MSTTEDLVTRIWAGVPELTRLAAALQSVRHRITLCMTREPEAPHLARRRLLHALVAGEPLPEDLGRRLHEESLTGEYHARELNVLTNLVTDLGTELSAARTAGADTALAVLDAELHQVLGEVRALELALRNVASADDAVHVGGDAVTAWQALTHLTGRYQRCRGLQINVTADALGDRHAATGLVDRNRYANRQDHQPLKAYLADGTDVAPPLLLGHRTRAMDGPGRRHGVGTERRGPPRRRRRRPASQGRGGSRPRHHQRPSRTPSRCPPPTPAPAEPELHHRPKAR